MRLNCKLCGSETHLVGYNLVCSNCGWHTQNNTTINRNSQKQIVKQMGMAGCIFVGLFAYLSYFGSHSLKVVPLKLKQLTNNLDAHSYKSLVQICTDLKQYNCVEKAHESYFQSSKDINILSTLASFQYRRKKMQEASLSYSRYFKMNGKDPQTAYNYARTLEALGKTNTALKFYEYSVYAKSENKLHITAMRDYINLLVKSNQNRKAQQALLKIQPSIQNASALIQQEYHRWEKTVKRG